MSQESQDTPPIAVLQSGDDELQHTPAGRAYPEQAAQVARVIETWRSSMITRVIRNLL